MGYSLGVYDQFATKILTAKSQPQTQQSGSSKPWVSRRGAGKGASESHVGISPDASVLQTAYI